MTVFTPKFGAKMPITTSHNQPQALTMPSQSGVGRLEQSPRLLESAYRVAQKLGSQRDLDVFKAALNYISNKATMPDILRIGVPAEIIVKSLDAEGLRNLALTCRHFNNLATTSKNAILTTGERLETAVKKSPNLQTVMVMGPLTSKQAQILHRLPALKALVLMDSGTTLTDLSANGPETGSLPSTLPNLTICGQHSITEVPPALLQQLPNLTSLMLDNLPELTTLPETPPASLQDLVVSSCPKVNTLPNWCVEALAVEDALLGQPFAQNAVPLRIQIDERLRPDELQRLRALSNFVLHAPLLGPLD